MYYKEDYDKIILPLEGRHYYVFQNERTNFIPSYC